MTRRGLILRWAAVALVLLAVVLGSKQWLGYAGASARMDRRYEEVRRLIGQGDWQAANSALSEIMLLAAGRESEGWFDRESIRSFPCSDLAYVELLYREGSGGRFGFAVQNAIWDPIAGSDRDRFLAFADAVGWRRDGVWLDYEALDFGPQAPPGHLPAFFPETRMRSPFKTRKGAPEDRALLQHLLDRRFETCLQIS